MGSGGLRGLQILRSGAETVRGRFDSYAFPPLLVAALVAAGLLLAEGPARAADPVPVRDPGVTPAATKSNADSVVVDSSLIQPPGRVIAVPSDPFSPEARRVRRDSVRAASRKLLDQPRFVMLRSLLVPGWGQLHNRAWIKAALVAGGEGALIANLVRDSRDLQVLERAVLDAEASGNVVDENLAVERYNARLDKYVGRQWLLGGLLVYALVDAYVDAHFVHFKFEFDHDPARPTEVRMGLEKRF